MKNFKSCILSLAFILLALNFVDAQKLSRKCIGSSQVARIEILANGNIEIVPCPNKTVSLNSGGTGNGQGLAGFTVTNTTPDRTLDPNDAGFTLAELANVTGTVITDLQTTGILNAVTPTTFELGDETTALTTGTKKTIRLPSGFTLIKAKASLTTASSSGVVTVDIKLNGSSIFGVNKLSIDATEKTTATAATAVSYSNNTLTDDGELTFVVTGAGTSAAGLKVYLIGRYAAP